jgi:hypothetical protein
MKMSRGFAVASLCVLGDVHSTRRSPNGKCVCHANQRQRQAVVLL